ncbi:hypothetical protein HDU77_000891 [Chytriomyces hyalinus]|nr:hypothetical protein HDU77_000891 [Chytriomyces hyalinus]
MQDKIQNNYKRLLQFGDLDLNGLKNGKPSFISAPVSDAGSSTLFLGSTPHLGQGCGSSTRIKYSFFVQMVPKLDVNQGKISAEGQITPITVAALTDGYESIMYFVELWKSYLAEGIHL